MKKKAFNLDSLSLFSHELKTPLSSLSLGLSLLEKDFNKNKNLIPLLKEELNYLNEFIKDNLDLRLLKCEKDLLELKWQSFDLLVEKSLSFLDLMAKKSNISFKIKKPLQDIEVFMDSSWMLRVLYNLLSNALNFSIKNSSIFVEFGLNKDNVFYCLTKNTSPQKVDTEKIFDLFYTKSFKQKVKGTGLGLNLVQNIIKAHKGEIKAYMESKQIVFYFTLPTSRFLKKVA